jgi:tetratricopeptide (TPR) repeat protein
MTEEAAQDPAPKTDAKPEGAPARKELEGFQVKINRGAPSGGGGGGGGNPMVMLLVVVAVMIGVGYGAVTLLGGGGSGEEAAEDEGSSGEEAPAQPPVEDVPVEDWVWDRLEFLESQDRYSDALDLAEEQLAVTPNAELRARIRSYKDETGEGQDAEPLFRIIDRADALLRAGDWSGAIDAAEEAMEIDEEDPRPYRIRGQALGEQGDKLGATNDLESALELGYEPAVQIEVLLKKYE